MALNLRREFKTDKVAEVSGVWFDHKGASFKVARLGNSNFRMMATEAYAKSGTLENNDYLSIFAETILLDWKGIVDDDGNEIPYSIDTAIEYLGYSDFFDLIHDFADNRRNFLENIIRDTSDKLKK